MLAILLLPATCARGQVRVRLSGQVETSAGLDTQRIDGHTSETTMLGSRYAPNLEGFVWDPRFMTFSLSGTYADQDTSLPEGELSVVQRDPYHLQLLFFPEAPHSLEVRAGRSVTDNLFSSRAGDELITTTIDGQSLTWRFRGTARLPETAVEFRRQTTETETPDFHLEERRTSLGVRLRKVLERSEPTLTYTVELLERDERPESRLLLPTGLGHEVRYEDRIRIGEQVFLTPVARFEAGEGFREAEAGATLAGPLSTTLDGSATARYAFQELGGFATQVMSASGVLTKRLAPDVTVTGGLNGVLVHADDITWGGGGFGGVSARPLPHLQTVADYGVQLTGDPIGLGVAHRAHVGAVSTWVPRHTLTADYYGSTFDPGGGRPAFTSHGVALGATSLALPWTTLAATAGGDRQDGDGRQTAYRGALSAVVTPFPTLSLRARGDVETVSRTGGDREPASEMRAGVEAGIDVSPLSWLSLSASAGRGVADVDREDRRGRFDFSAARGSIAVLLPRLLVRGEGFMEDEPSLDQRRHGVRASISYRFRVWTIGVDVERVSITTGGTEVERDRVLFRITRPLDLSWP